MKVIQAASTEQDFAGRGQFELALLGGEPAGVHAVEQFFGPGAETKGAGRTAHGRSGKVKEAQPVQRAADEEAHQRHAPARQAVEVADTAPVVAAPDRRDFSSRPELAAARQREQAAQRHQQAAAPDPDDERLRVHPHAPRAAAERTGSGAPPERIRSRMAPAPAKPS